MRHDNFDVRTQLYAQKYNDSGEQRPMFKFVLKDYTGSVECLYFPRKSTGKGESPAEKMRNLGENSTILVSGVSSSNTYNGKTTVTVKANAISLCDLPQDFVLNREKCLCRIIILLLNRSRTVVFAKRYIPCR